MINLFSPSPSRVKPLVGSTHLGLTYLHVTLSRLRRLYGFYQSELSSFYRTCQLRSTSQRPFCDHDLQVNTSHASTFLFNCHSIALNTFQLNHFSTTYLRSRPTGLLMATRRHLLQTIRGVAIVSGNGSDSLWNGSDRIHVYYAGT